MANYIGTSRTGQTLAGPAGLIISVINAPDNLTQFTFQGIHYDLELTDRMVGNQFAMQVDCSQYSFSRESWYTNNELNSLDEPINHQRLTIRSQIRDPTVRTGLEEWQSTCEPSNRQSCIDGDNLRNRNLAVVNIANRAIARLLTIRLGAVICYYGLHNVIYYPIPGFEDHPFTEVWITPDYREVNPTTDDFLLSWEPYLPANMPRTTFQQRQEEQRRVALADADRRRADRLRTIVPEANIRENIALQNAVPSEGIQLPERHTYNAPQQVQFELNGQQYRANIEDVNRQHDLLREQAANARRISPLQLYRSRTLPEETSITEGMREWIDLYYRREVESNRRIREMLATPQPLRPEETFRWRPQSISGTDNRAQPVDGHEYHMLSETGLQLNNNGTGEEFTTTQLSNGVELTTRTNHVGWQYFNTGTGMSASVDPIGQVYWKSFLAKQKEVEVKETDPSFIPKFEEEDPF